MPLRTRTLTATLTAVVLSLFWLLAFVGSAEAHTGEQSYIYFEIFDTEIAGEVQIPVADINAATGLSIPEDETGMHTAIAANLDEIHTYILEHFSVGDGVTTWPIEFHGWRVLEFPPGSYGIFEFELGRTFDQSPREFTVFFDAVLHQNPDRDALLIIETDWQSGTFQNEARGLLRYTPGSTTQVVSLAEASFWKGMAAVTGLGIQHIRIGTDHILFVLALVLPSVLVFTAGRRWQPAPTFGSSLWRVLKIVSMFTVAHSITLALGGFGIVELPTKLVEAVIAISIALAALHNIRPLFPNKEWLMAFGFGLFHGFGFAGLLSDLGLDRSQRVASLLGFNVGIEIGQAVIILLVFPALFLARRTRVYERAMYVASGLLAIVALGWAVERVLEAEIGVSQLIDPLVAWPRAFFVVVIATAAAWGLYARDRAQGKLRAVAAQPEPEETLAPVGA